jgi:hypothetical protein
VSATYDPELPSNRDHVRFLIGDTDTAAALLSDEEIDAVITAETATGDALKYYAAARCLEALVTRWASAGHGVVEKQVSKLRVRRGLGESAGAVLERAIRELRKRGSYLLSPSPKVFRALG